MATFTIVDARPLLPAGLPSLREAADREGVANVAVLVERWRDGGQRFLQRGESVLAALDAAGEVIAVGALTECPHVPGALRVRRFYVAPEWRRRGVATALASELVARASTITTTITCNAQASAAAPPFWESLGFEPTSIDGITHVRRSHPSTS